MSEQSNHEKLQSKLVPEQEKQLPEISPAIVTQMAKDRARDLAAQKSGQISTLYDLGSEAPVPEGGIASASPLENTPRAIPIETPEHINERLLQSVGKVLKPGEYGEK